MEGRIHVIPAIGAALLLIVALGSHPYGYYTFLRWVVCIARGLVVYQASQARGQEWAVWVFGVIVVLWNPLVPVHLGRETWAILDVVAAILFGIGAAELGEGEA